MIGPILYYFLIRLNRQYKEEDEILRAQVDSSTEQVRRHHMVIVLVDNYDLATERYGIPPTDLFFDPLTFPLSAGTERTRRQSPSATTTPLPPVVSGTIATAGVLDVPGGTMPPAATGVSIRWYAWIEMYG